MASKVKADKPATAPKGGKTPKAPKGGTPPAPKPTADKDVKVATIGKPELKKVAIATLKLEGRFQHRDDSQNAPTFTNEARVDQYAELMEAGITFAPVRVASTKEGHYLIGGFHSLAAARRMGQTKISASVYKTDMNGALWLSAAENQHGAVRNREAIRAAIRAALSLPGMENAATRQIARHIGCSNSTVAVVRQELEQMAQVPGPDGTTPPKPSTKRTYTDKHGKVTTMETANIGRKKKDKEAVTAPSAPEGGTTHTSSNGEAASNGTVHQSAPVAPVEQVAPVHVVQEAAPVPVKDTLGNEIPERLRPAFASFALVDMADTMSSFIVRLRDGSDAGSTAHLRLTETLTAMETAERELRAAIPYAICPVCQGLLLDGSCEMCVDTGFLTKEMCDSVGTPLTAAEEPVE